MITITGKTKEMILSNDIELLQLVKAMLDGQEEVIYTDSFGTDHSISLPKRYKISTLSYKIGFIEGQNYIKHTYLI